MMMKTTLQRHINRLRDFDYSSPGAYFVTICVKHYRCLFGAVQEGSVVLNEVGKIVDKCWRELVRRYNYVDIDNYTIMPNHIHGIIIIKDFYGCRGGSRAAQISFMGASRGAPPTKEFFHRKPLGQLIGVFKASSTSRIRLLHHQKDTVIWQRNFYEHVVRDEEELIKIRKYIHDNPIKWSLRQDDYHAEYEGLPRNGGDINSARCHLSYGLDINHEV